MSESTDPLHAAAERLRVIETWLAAAGLTTRLHASPNAMDLTATLRQPGHREIEVVIDEDGYTELRYWASLSDTPAQTVAIVTSALAAITAIQGSVARIVPARQTHVAVAGYDGAITERAGASGMPGPQDRVAEQEHSPDLARPREPDHPREAPAQSGDLQTRLERLPVGHPSSPYRDDGSRKPPAPDLANYELPLPDELPPDPDHADARLPEDASSAEPGDSWLRAGRELSPERSRMADQALTRCRDIEGRDVDGNYGDLGLTPAMRRIEAQLDHGHLTPDTERFALKDPDRFKEKFARLIERYPGTDPNELVHSIHDGVRYTFILDFDPYTETVDVAQRRLTDAGYDRIETKPGWDGDEYKGVNSRWREPSTGVLFEVQFHTQDSWNAKQETHDAYAKIQAAVGTSVEEKERLRTYQCEIVARVPIPPGALDIQPYKKER
jgi:hypothetical protein